MRILSQNKLSDGVLTYSSQLERYKFADAFYDNALCKWGKFSGSSNQYLQVTYSVATKIYYAALINTNLSTSASVRLLCSNDGFTTTAATYNLTKVNDGWYYRNDAGLNYKAYRITITDVSVTYLRISKLYIGGYIQMPGMSEFTKSVKSNAKYDRSDSGQLYGYSVNQTMTYSATFDDLDKTDYDAISACFATYDKVKPFLLIPYEDTIAEEPPAWVHIADDPEYKQLITSGQRYSLSLKFEQCF